MKLSSVITRHAEFALQKNRIMANHGESWRIMVRYPSVLSYTMMFDVKRWKHGHIGDVAMLSVVVYYNKSYPHIADFSSTISLMTASHPCTIYLSYKHNMTDS